MKKLWLSLALLGAFLSVASLAEAQSLRTDNGDRLLQAVKAVADSGRADDLTEVSTLMHLSFNRVSHESGQWCAPMAKSVRNEYAAAGTNWFPPPPDSLHKIYVSRDNPLLNVAPNGQVAAYDIGFGFVEIAEPDTNGKSSNYTIFNHPGIELSISGVSGCQDGHFNRTDATLVVTGIPAYACITREQIKAVFHGAKPPSPPPPGSSAPMGAESEAYKSHGGSVGFYILPIPVNGQRDGPDCLISMYLNADFPLGPLHQPDFAK